MDTTNTHHHPLRPPSPSPLPPPDDASKAFPLPELDHPDFLAIDDLLDFSNDDIAAEDCIQPCSSSAATDHSTSDVPENKNNIHPTTPSSSSSGATAALDSDELCVPCDELAELEWLSNFVEESFSCGSSAIAYGGGKEKNAETKGGLSPSASPVSVLQGGARGEQARRGGAATAAAASSSCSPDNMSSSSFRGRARSKRYRNNGGVCFWNSRILCAEASESILVEAATSTTSTITAASSDSDMYTTYFEEEDDEEEDGEEEEEAEAEEEEEGEEEGRWGACSVSAASTSWVKKQGKRQRKGGSRSSHGDGVGGGRAEAKKNNNNNNGSNKDKEGGGRKCLHCATQKTPQWRAGPLGPKTLCNACGVRYKSGRLCPEYRPASSPTFDHHLHSNSHRKVLEMRRHHYQIPPSARAPSLSPPSAVAQQLHS